MLKYYKKYTYNISFVYTQPEPVQTWIYQPQPILRPICPFQTLLVLIEAFPKYLEVKRDSIKRSIPCYGTNFCKVYRAAIIFSSFAEASHTKRVRHCALN